MTRKTKLERILASLSHDRKELIEQYTELYKDWKKVRKVNKTALSSKDFRLFVYLREAEKI